ncbi:MAG: carbon-nitrogen family hydrolase [Phycisphaeraceae bacterium]|nr:carbon-nitrogen family hydrolase [Phycisphaeraceae bacterium]
MPEILIIQLDITWQDPMANIAQARRMIQAQSVEPGSLILLPEMYATGFCPADAKKFAEPVGGRAQQFLAEKAARTASHVLGGVMSRPRKSGGKAFNEAVGFDPQCREIVRYRKTHLFPLADEPKHLSAGRKIVTFDWQGFTVMPVICYDLRFPELFRAGLREGVNFFVVLANWPASRAEHWTTLLRARAIENQAFVVGVNRCGRDPHAEYAGQSVVFDPRGRVVAQADDKPSVLRATIAISDVEASRRDFPAWRQALKR